MKTLNLEKAIKKIKKETDGIYDFQIERENGHIYVVDHTEEFYYGGFRFDAIYEQLNNAVEKDNKDAYLDCVCPGRYCIG